VTFQPQFTPSNWRRQCLQDRIVSLLQVMHTAKTTKVEPSYKSCHNDICFKTKTVVAHAAKCWTWHARFFTCDFITDWSIASYQEILWSIVVEDKLTTPSLYSCRWNVTLQVLYQLLWYCSEVTKQSGRWNVTLQVLYQLPCNSFSYCDPLHVSLNSTSSRQFARFEPWRAQKLPEARRNS